MSKSDKIYDLGIWVADEDNPIDKQKREAFHTILLAISNSQNLHASMIMKGAVLLAIRYNCIRYTTDIDFSTHLKASEFDIDRFISDFDQSLILATETLDYGLDCRVQSHKRKPPNENATFPTLKLKIGYAYKDDRNNHKRLIAHKSLHVVEIDYSFNEVTQETESLKLKAGGTLSVYSFTDLIAEKYRAILQQEKRKRFRRQDIFDLYFLFNNYHLPTLNEKRKILKSLIKKAESRELQVDRNSMSNKEIIRRSKKRYHLLSQEINIDLPDFDAAYTKIRSFYESLPWETKE